MPPRPSLDETYQKPINFTPNPADAELMRELHEKTGIRGGPLLRMAIKALALQHRRLDVALPPNRAELSRRARRAS